MKYLIAILAALLVAGCGSSGKSVTQAQAAGVADSSDSEYVATDARGIQTMTIRNTTVPDYLELTAHVEADPTRVVRVYPPASGRIIEMQVRPWDHVEKGQTLATIESGDLSRDVAEYHKALSDAQLKQKQLDRTQDLFEHHATSEREYQQAQADLKAAQEELAATKEQIRVFGMDPDAATTQLRVAAPRSGVILDIAASPGEFSNALAAPAPLATVADIGTVWAIGDIYEKDLSAAKLGQEAQVTLSAYPDQKWMGRVSIVSDTVDSTTRTLHMRVVLSNPDARIKPGMFGSIRILRSSSQGILVPSTAVIRESNEAYVFAGKGNGRFERRDVKLGRSVGDQIEIASGVTAGDTLVSQGGLLLRSAAQE